MIQILINKYNIAKENHQIYIYIFIKTKLKMSSLIIGNVDAKNKSVAFHLFADLCEGILIFLLNLIRFRLS